MKINFCGPVLSASGYGEFSRYFVSGLYRAGVDVSAELIPIDVNQNLDYGSKGLLCKKLIKKKVRAEINIVNMIPLLFKKYMSPNAINIGFTMWEADQLPQVWVKLCNDMDAIFVPCKWNKEVFEDSGVTVPIYVVQPGIDEDDIPSISTKEGNEEYKFYSIFQWTARKNPEALLKAYFSTFAGYDDVSLTLKVYKHQVNNGLSIEQEIAKIQSGIRLSPGKSFPKVNIIQGVLPKEGIGQIHRNHDCFVSTHCSEAWGLSLMDAMVHGNLVIATNYSGNTDFMDDTNSLITGFQNVPVSNMGQYAPWFFADQMNWADIDVMSLCRNMKYAYEERVACKVISLQGRRDILNKFNDRLSVAQLLDSVEDLRGKDK